MFTTENVKMKFAMVSNLFLSSHVEILAKRIFIFAGMSANRLSTNEKFPCEAKNHQTISKESHTKNKSSKRGYLKYSKADVVPALEAIKKGT